jgi:hypothetical protein
MLLREIFRDVAYQSTSKFSAPKGSSSQHYINCHSSTAAGDILLYMASLVPGSDIHLIISHDYHTTTSFPINF